MRLVVWNANMAVHSIGGRGLGANDGNNTVINDCTGGSETGSTSSASRSNQLGCMYE